MSSLQHDLDVFRALGGMWVPLPATKATTEVFFWGGRRGAGKSYGCGVLVEELLEAGGLRRT